MKVDTADRTCMNTQYLVLRYRSLSPQGENDGLESDHTLLSHIEYQPYPSFDGGSCKPAQAVFTGEAKV